MLKLIPLKRLKHMPSRALCGCFLGRLGVSKIRVTISAVVDPSGIAVTVGGSDLKKNSVREFT